MRKRTLENICYPQIGGIVTPLLQWYDAHARILPWRENTHPYRVWVSEIMLQQTQVATVLPYFERFIRALPDVPNLASADEAQLLKLWEGLGYYSRVRNMHKAAKILAEKYGGVFPKSYDALLALPGIGSYTAGAICSISFGMPVPAVDGNVLRVMARLTGLEEDIADARVKDKITALLQSVYPDERSGDFTQSLMELGATVCLPKRAPDCGRCPLQTLCTAYRTDTQAVLPVKSGKKPRRQEKITVLLLRCGDRVAVRRREANGLLGGLWEFPNAQGHLTPDEVKALTASWGIDAANVVCGAGKKHIFTHIEWDMQSYVVDCKNTGNGFLWVTGQELERQIALPSAFRTFRP